MLGLAALMLTALFVLPIWRIDLLAPQYPEGLGMLIRINTVTGLNPTDLDNINNLNHYIGMKPITPEAIPELVFMPWIVGALVVFGVVAAFIGRRKLAIAWVASVVGFAVIGLIDFWRWGYDYGHDLDVEHAIIKVPGMVYQPPVIGTKQLLNFTAMSWPDAGAIIAGIAVAIAIAALFLARKPGRRTEAGAIPSTARAALRRTAAA
jgi:hypothetical protein